MDSFRINNTSTSTFDETWEPVWGENSHIRNRYNELFVELEKPSNGRFMNLRFVCMMTAWDSAMSSLRNNICPTSL